jgi:hypothetical protein
LERAEAELDDLQLVLSGKVAAWEEAKEQHELARQQLATYDAQVAAGDVAQDDARRQELQQELGAAGQRVTSTTVERDAAMNSLRDRRNQVETEVAEKTSRLAQLSRNLKELREMESGTSGGPMKLEDVCYMGSDGAEQAIFLPVLKTLIVFRCMVCLPTPQQIAKILKAAKQGYTLFTQEPVPSSEDIQQFAVRIKNYSQAAQLIGTPLDATHLLVLGLKDQELRSRLETALSVMTGHITLDEVARKAVDIQAKIQGLELVTSMRGLYNGRGALVAGGGCGDEDGAAGSSSGSGASKLESQVAALTAQVEGLAGALAAGGFKQAGKFAGGSSSGGGISKGSGAAEKQESGQGGQRPPPCPTCGRRHKGECWGKKCEKCGRPHNPAEECWGKDYKPKGRRRWNDRGDRREERAGAAAAGRGHAVSDEEAAAAAADGLDVWNLGGACNVAALLVAGQAADATESLDDGLSGAALAGGSLKQMPPASFHQAKPGVLTRRAAKLAAEAGAGEEGEAAVADEVESLQEWAPEPATKPKGDSADATFEELRGIAPTDSHVLLALDPSRDAELLKGMLSTGAESALAVVRMPSMTFRELLDRQKLDLLPAATVAASPAVLAAATAKHSSSVIAEETLLLYMKGDGGCSSSGGGGGAAAAAHSKMQPMLPYLRLEGYKLYDVTDKRALQVARMLADSGAQGGLISLEMAKRHRLGWRALEGVQIATADGGAAAPIGVTEGVKFIALPGTPHATAVPFDALVMDTGGKGVYDAILGREQMHMLGMVMDFGRQRCWIRPRLKQGCWDLVEMPWSCVRSRGAAAGAACAVADFQAATESATLDKPELGGWEGAQEACLMAAGDVERNPGPLLEGELERLPIVEVESKETSKVKLRRRRVNHPYVGHRRLCLDYRNLEKDLVVDVWAGEAQARLMVSGDVEPHPGPLRGNFVTHPGVGQLLAVLLCAFTACSASLVAVGYAAAGRLFSAGLMAAVAVWAAVTYCWPVLMAWASLKLELAKAPRARRPTKRLSWQLLSALLCQDAAKRVRHRKFRLGVSLVLLLLVMLSCCGVVAATAGAMGQSVQGMLGGGTAGVAGAYWTEPGNFRPHTVELLAGEVTGAFTAGHIPGTPHPTELLDALQPAGEKDRPQFAPEVTVDPDGKWQFAHNPDGTPEEHAQLQAAVRERKHAFAYSHAEMPGYIHKVGWKMKHSEPVKEPCHSRRKSPAEEKIMDEKCTELQGAGLIGEIPTTNDYATHAVLAAKKDGVTGEWTDTRMCQDYRRLNRAMVSDSYTPPLPEDIFAAAAGCKVWSVIDMRAGFHQLVLDEESARTTAFWWGRRLMQYNRLSFGTKNATAIYQRVMDEVLREGGCSGFAMAYVDDLLLFTPDMQSHIEAVKKVLDCIHKVGLRAHPEKSIFGASQVEYLGHMVSADGLSPTKAKVAAIQALPSPRNINELRCIMGILNYYRVYIPAFSIIAAPINQLLKADAVFEWTTEREAAYQRLKQLMADPELVLRPADPNRQFVLHTDWSCHGIGAVLGQIKDGKEYMVACASRSLNQHERRYTPWKGELLAAVWGIKTFRHYLHGCKEPFVLVTDHRPLLGLLTTSEPNCQQVRWLMAVQDHDFVVQHRAGVKHTNADALSRFPDPSELDTAGARMDRGPLPAPVLPDVIMADGRRLAGEEAAAELADNWQEQMLQEQQPAAGVAAAILMTEAQLDVYGPPVPGWMDGFAPSAYELAGCMAATPNTTELPSYQQHREQALQAQASELVRAAQQKANSRNLTAGGGVDTSSCAGTFFTAARRRGITLFEPFGGLGAGLEMVLRHGMRVNRYVYADTSESAQKVMRHRLTLLSGRYPHLLAPEAWEKAFETLPMDVYDISGTDLAAAVQQGEQWLVVAGWECQDLSPAGGGKGLKGNRSSTYFQLLRVLDGVQGAAKAKGNPPVGYLLENTAFQYHWSPEVAGRDFAAVCDVLGTPLEVDAARFGSRAHRLRNYWTNLGEPSKLAAAVTCAERPPGLTVQQILEHGRSPMPVVYASRPPWYPCNKVGQPREALPTLMAYEGSYSFKPRRSGSIWDESTQEYTEPTAQERELALGYAANDTAAEGISELERRQVLGRCMDANTVQALFGICEAWHDAGQQEAESKGVFVERPAVVAAALETQHEGLQCSDGLAAALAMGNSSCNATKDMRSALVAEAQQYLAEDKLLPVGGGNDPWEDDALLHLLQHGSMPEEASQAERDRLAKRAKRYSWSGDKLLQKCADGELRVVPKPGDRLELVASVHKQCGHLGVRRTIDLLSRSYQWRGMYRDVQHVVRRCEPCERARVSFAGVNPTLTPLPVKGMFYRWHVDLCGPFAESTEGYTYVMVAVEAYSKVLELAPLKNKSADSTAAAFLDMVLCRYGACAEVCSDRGAEWDAAFSDALVDCMVVHRPTAAQHPQANGAAERSIQSVKRSIRKCAESEGSAKDWPKHLPWIRLGYNCSRQESTRLAPYTLLYGVGPTIPPAVKEQLEQPVDFDDAEAAATELVSRQALMRKNLVMAGENLAIAQERDTLRYAQVRDGQYLPRVRVFQEGDYVYLKPATRVCEHMKGSGLVLDVEPRKLRVVKAKQDGTVELIGRDGGRMTVNASNLTLCHLPDIDGTIDLSMAYVEDDLACEGCHSPYHEADMLVCDNCLEGWHIWCLTPPLDKVPPEEEPWLCDKCKAAGVTEADIQDRQLASALNQEEEERQRAFKRAYNPSAVQKRRDSRNAAMQGRLVRKVLADGEQLWGKVHYRGNADGRRPYLVVYQDGSEEVCGNHAVAKRPGWLMPEGVALPSGVMIPEPSSAALGAVLAGAAAAARQKVRTHPWPFGSGLSGPRTCEGASLPEFRLDAGRGAGLLGEETVRTSVNFEGGQLRRLLQSLNLPRGLRYLDPFAGEGLMVRSLRALGVEPVTSDRTRGEWHLQASPLNGDLYRLVKPDVVISLLTEAQAGRFWAPLLRRCSSAAAIVLVVRVHPQERASATKDGRRLEKGCAYKLLVHDPRRLLQAGGC